MKVTFAIPELNLSGGNRVIFDYARHLMQRGHAVTVLHPAPGQTTPQQHVKAVVKAVLHSGYRSGSPPHGLNSGVPVQTGKTAGRLTEEDFPDADIAIVTWWETGEWVAGLSASKGRKVHLVQDHEIFPPQPAERVRHVYAMPWPKITVSRWLDDICVQEYSGSDRYCVPNGVDLKQFTGSDRMPAKIPVAGMVWSASERKNSSMGLDALRLVKARIPPLQAILFGSVPPPLRIGSCPWITYHYRPEQQAIPDLYAACRAWLFPSRSEGFGLPILEAMAMNTPLVATTAGAAPDLVDGTNGIRVACSADDMADGLIRLLTEPAEVWVARSAAARATAQANSFASAAASFEAALKTIASR